MAYMDDSSWNDSDSEYSSSPKCKKVKTIDSSRNISKETVMDKIDKNTLEKLVETSAAGMAEATTDNVTVNIAENTGETTVGITPETRTKKIVEYTAETIAENTTNNKAANTIETTAVNTDQTNTEITDVNTAENTAETKENTTADTMVEITSEYTTENNAGTTAETTGETMAETIAENTTETTAETTADTMFEIIALNTAVVTTDTMVDITDENAIKNITDTTAENNTETTAETTAENTAETTGVITAKNTAEMTAESTTGDMAQTMIENIAENTAKTTADTMVEITAENATETQDETTAENTAETTGVIIAKNIAEMTAKSTTGDMAETMVETTTATRADNTAENMAEPTVQTTAEITTEITADKTVEITAETTTENRAEITAEVSSESTAESTAESTCSDDTDCPANEVVIVAPSTSAVQAILLNITRKRRARNYGKSKSPSEDSDSSSKDSDDLSIEETPSTSRQDEEMEIDEHPVETESRNSGAEEPLLDFQSDDDDDFGGTRSRGNNTEPQNEQNPPAVLLKERPKHNYSILKEVLNRELGLSFPRGQTTKEDVMFTQRFYSSLHAVYRMEKLHTLVKHKRCVNTINFNPEGHLLVSGSDDTSVIVWDWARRIPLHTIENVHKSNVFQSKFLYLNSNDQLNIVTCARDGLVKLLQCSSAGGTWSRRRLAGHTKAVNKLFVTPLEPHSVLSAGEDGFVLHCDLRVDTVNKLIQLKQRSGAMALHSVHGHPLNVMELVVAGRDKFARVYDRRMSSKPLALYCPTPFTEQPSIINRTMRLTTIHLTCAVYNHDGTEILGSYSDDDIYLFNTKSDLYNKDEPNQEKDGYSFRYSGHRNSSILKPVAFYGPKSEYILSGSDCGHIYIWEKHSESIVQWLKADANGVSNTVEGHPRIPILASSGLDKDVKIWAPYSDEDPSYHGMSSTVTNNCATQWQNPLFNDFLPTLYRSWRGENRLVVDDENLPYSGNVELEANVCTTF